MQYKFYKVLVAIEGFDTPEGWWVYKSTLDLETGCFIEVPFGKKVLYGVVIEEVFEISIDINKIREVERKIITTPNLRKSQIEFLQWMANWTFSNSGDIFKLMLSTPDLFNVKEDKFLIVKGISDKILTKKQQDAYYFIDNLGGRVKKSDFLVNYSVAILKKLLKISAVEEIFEEKTFSHYVQDCNCNCNLSDLNDEQKHASDMLIKEANKGFNVSLLDGVTGSGKTEVYFSLIYHYLMNTDKQVLILLPEIALTSQWEKRFKEKFFADSVVWHSKMNKSNRKSVWLGILNNSIRVVVGARSSLFLPFHNLGLIIIDEEHEHSYKQEDNPSYHCRDMAIMYAKFCKAQVLLASATPSLETIQNVNDGRYSYVPLLNNFSGVKKPELEIIDLRIEKLIKGRSLTSKAVELIRRNIDSGNQSLIFINRRGYNPITVCKGCGEKVVCDYCSANLVLHEKNSVNFWLCHYCGFKKFEIVSCKKCGSGDSFVAFGVAIEKVYEEVVNTFTDVACCQVSSDVVGSDKDIKYFLDIIENNEVKIIVSTQFLARGWHFGNLTQVVILDADFCSVGSDIRASEKGFQLLYQLIGRAGREKEGNIVIQSYQPDSKVIQAIKNSGRDDLYQNLLQERKEFNMPPFSRIASIVISGKSQGKVISFSRIMKDNLPKVNGVRVLGPVSPYLFKHKNNYRQRFMVIASKDKSLQDFIKFWLNRQKKINGIQVFVDIDPYNFI